MAPKSWSWTYLKSWICRKCTSMKFKNMFSEKCSEICLGKVSEPLLFNHFDFGIHNKKWKPDIRGGWGWGCPYIRKNARFCPNTDSDNRFDPRKPITANLAPKSLLTLPNTDLYFFSPHLLTYNGTSPLLGVMINYFFKKYHFPMEL